MAIARRRRTLVSLLALCAIAAACARAPEEAAPAQTAEQQERFDSEGLDLNRPCTLLLRSDAEAVTGQPFFRTFAADRVEPDGSVRCSVGVGAGGLQGMAEASIHLQPEGRPAELYYVSVCRGEAGLSAGAAGPPGLGRQSAAANGAAPIILARNCVLSNGAYVLLLEDRLLIVSVRDAGGGIDPEASLRLAALLSTRVGARG